MSPTPDSNTIHGFSMIIPYDHTRQSAFQACRFISMNTTNPLESERRSSSAPDALLSDVCKYYRNIYNAVVSEIHLSDNILSQSRIPMSPIAPGQYRTDTPTSCIHTTRPHSPPEWCVYVPYTRHVPTCPQVVSQRGMRWAPNGGLDAQRGAADWKRSCGD